MRTLAGWRARIISMSCSRVSVSLTGFFAFIASSTAIAWLVISILPPKAPPTRGETARIRDIGMPRRSARLAWSLNTDWFDDHTVTLPLASTSAIAEHGSR